MTRRALLQAAGAIVLVWHRVPAIQAEPTAAAAPGAGLIVDHQGWIVRATDRDALARRVSRRPAD